MDTGLKVKLLGIIVGPEKINEFNNYLIENCGDFIINY